MAISSSLARRIEEALARHPRGRALVLIVFFLLLLTLFASLIHLTLRQNTIGMDYYTFWLAGQRVLERQNPYDETVAIQSQLGIMRRLAGPQDDQMGFAYPPYALLPTLPFAYLPFDWAQAFWLAFCFLTLVSALYAAQPARATRLMVIVLTFFPVTFGLLLGNFVIPIGALLLLLLARLVLYAERQTSLQIMFGALLAWTTIKPQFVILYLIFLAFFAIQQRLWPFIISFVLSTLGLGLISFILVPGWPALWLNRLTLYAGYMQTYPMAIFLLRSFLPPLAASLLATALLLLSLWVGYHLWQRWQQNKLPLPLLLAWLGLCAYLLHPRNVAYAQIAFLLPFFYWLLNRPSWQQHPIPTLLLIGIPGSWAVFALAKLLPAPNLADELRLALYAAWCLWLFIPQQEDRHAT